MGTLDLSEFNVDVMTGNNGAHQRSPNDPGTQKWPFFYVQTPEMFFTFTGRFTRLGQQIFPGIMFDTVFHPFNFIIML